LEGEKIILITNIIFIKIIHLKLLSTINTVMSIANETAEKDKLIRLASETISKLNENVEEIGEKIRKNTTNKALNKSSLNELYDNYCKRGDCKDIDDVNNLLQYLEDSLSSTNDQNVKDKIKNAIKQVKETLQIKY
jgi:archaellum component FlaC